MLKPAQAAASGRNGKRLGGLRRGAAAHSLQCASGDRAMWKRLVFLILVLAWGYHWWSHREFERAPGVLAAEAPQQVGVAGISQRIHAGATITPLATFDLQARVLGVKRYRFDQAASLAPYDLALGWGRMSDSEVLAGIDISQSARFYFWTARRLPIPRAEIVASSANMHIIPANDAVRAELDRLRVGHLVRLRGYLVMAERREQGVWLSSMTRTDSGNGACELVLAESIAVLE
jgi:hypothetical protein